MIAYAERIRRLRSRTGKDVEEVAASIDMQPMEYMDLELHDGELLAVPSLAAIKRLAGVLGVSVPALLSEDGAEPLSRRLAWAEVVERVNLHLREAGLSRAAFEEQIGWTLNDFFVSEERALEAYSAEFLKSLCDHIGVPWLSALP